MFIKLRQQTDAIFFHGPSGLITVFVILEAMFRQQPAHPDINARFRRIAFWIRLKDGAVLRRLLVQQYHVHVVMMLGGS